MNKKLIVGLIVIAAIGVAAFGYWTISPLFINVRVSEDMPFVAPQPTGTVQEQPEPTVLSQGEFIGVEGHNAEGTAEILDVAGKKYIRFEENFKVTNGPDLFVYLGKNGQYDSAANLGRLKGNIGSQNYEIPTELDISEYDSVWVWCRAFRVGFGVTNLK